MQRLLASILLAVGLLGCGTEVQWARTNQAPHPVARRRAREVAVFTSGVPDRAYTEIGMIQGRQESTWSDDELADIIGEMRRSAGRHGCDALIIHSRADSVSGSVYGGGAGGNGYVHGSTEQLDGLLGTCVVYN
jgi:hypothetical protein